MTRALLVLGLVPVLACRGGDGAEDDAGGTSTTPAAAPEIGPPDERGPYGVGVKTLQFTDTRGKDLTVEVWFPADTSGDPWPDPYVDIPITRSAHREVPADRRGAPYPVIGFSHGLGAIRIQSATLVEHLASQGFVVISPDHPGHLLEDYIAGFDSSQTGTVIMERPGDVSEAIDHVVGLTAEEDPDLAGLSDDEAIAMVGHSFGAINTLMIAGAEDDLPGLETWCEDNRGSACSYVDDIDFSVAANTDFADPRVVVAVAMSPGAAYAFGSEGEGLAGLPPTLVLGGTKDGTLPWEREIRPVYDNLTAPRMLAELADAGHYAPFSDMCNLLATFEDCRGSAEGFMEPDVGHAIVNPLVSAWIRRHLLQDVSMDAFLGEDFAQRFDQLTLHVDR